MKTVRPTGWRGDLGFSILLAAWLAHNSPVQAQQSADYVPMDPIPDVIETLPDPCDNPTTRIWGPNDEKGNLNYLTADRIRDN